MSTTEPQTSPLADTDAPNPEDTFQLIINLDKRTGRISWACTEEPNLLTLMGLTTTVQTGVIELMAQQQKAMMDAIQEQMGGPGGDSRKIVVATEAEANQRIGSLKRMKGH